VVKLDGKTKYILGETGQGLQRQVAHDAAQVRLIVETARRRQHKASSRCADPERVAWVEQNLLPMLF